MLINEMAAAAGFQNKLDPLLMQCVQGLPKQVPTSVSGAGLIMKFEILRETENDPNFYCTFLIGRAKRRIQYNRRFVNVVQTFGRKRGPNANS